jgi:hydrogenase maturation protease
VPLIIGCGNLLRGDDAVGPLLVRHLAEMAAQGRVPHDVRLADGGTAGMDVAFAMRGQRHVVIVDASTGTGEPPGTVHRVPGAVLEELPPPQGMNLHSFRWQHALSFGRWLLKGDYPERIDVHLVAAQSTVLGEALSPVVETAMHALAERLVTELAAEAPLTPRPEGAPA